MMQSELLGRMHAVVLADQRVVLLAGALVLLIGAVAFLQVPVSEPVGEYGVYASFSGDVDNLSMGMSVDGDRVDFGTLPVQAVDAEKRLTLANHEERSVVMRLRVTGNVSEFVTVEPATFVLHPEEDREVYIRLNVPEDVMETGYEGTLVVEERVPLWRKLR